MSLQLLSTSPVIHTAPIGPSQRRYANAAATVSTRLDPDALLYHLKNIEGAFGTRHRRRWSSRVLDLDIILWKERDSQRTSLHISDQLAVPHPAFRERDFVLKPAAQIAGQWRDPVTGASISQLLHRLQRARHRSGS